MNKFFPLILLGLGFVITGCSPVKTAVINQYKLDSFSVQRLGQSYSRQSIFISLPEAAAGYQDSTMMYVRRPFELNSFTKNSWVDQPANMLLPLLAQSLQSTSYFYAVTSTANSEHTDYRLDTQLIKLQQNFLTIPSQVDFAAKVVLTHVSDKRVIASRLFSDHVKCPSDTPYGGVIAANKATRLFTAKVSKFVVAHVNKDSLLNDKK
ncbi:MAG: membrane integrity-associated transporter subunit PqiC [Tatlockia sp.]|nr:membrane integrity-associated transporter subunit PqiC [Tatlockia sp.]